MPQDADAVDAKCYTPAMRRTFGVSERELSRMAGSGSRATSQIRQRIAGFFRRQTTWPQFIDPRAHSWAREVKSYSDLPVQYRPFFQNIGAGAPEALPYSVLTPTFRGGYGYPETERLLCILGGEVHVLESAEGHLRCSSYAPEHVHMIEYGVLLLHSWITIRGRDDSGTIRSVMIRFNSVSDYLMSPFVDCLRGPDQEGLASVLESERAKLDYLAAHYKFRTYGRACVRAGALVCQTIFQPEIRHEQLRVLGISFSRLLSPAHLCMLTNSELIDIRDDSGQRWSKGSPHGAIWTYIPRGKISGAALAPQADGTREFSVNLPGGLCSRSLFGSDKTGQLEEMIGALGV